MPRNVRCAIADIDVTIRNRDSWLPQMEKKKKKLEEIFGDLRLNEKAE